MGITDYFELQLRASLESPSDSGINNGLSGPTNRARRKFENLAGYVKNFPQSHEFVLEPGMPDHP